MKLVMILMILWLQTTMQILRRFGLDYSTICHSNTGPDIAMSHMFVFLFQSLSELPSPIVNGSILTVEDLQQELSCKINVKHRFFISFTFWILFQYQFGFLESYHWLIPKLFNFIKSQKLSSFKMGYH